MQNFKSYLDQLEFDQNLWKSFHAKWIVNFRLVLLLILTVIALGVVSIFTLPRRLNPEVKIPIVVISTVLPGAGPEDIESLITRPEEDVLLGMDKLDTITSVSNENVSVITMQFVSTANRDKARDDVQAKLDAVTLPEDAQAPKVIALDFENQPVWTFSLSSKGDVGSLMRFADTLKDKIKDIHQVSSVDMSGFDTQEVTVLIDPAKVHEYGINPALLSAAVKKAASSYPAGNLDGSSSLFTLTIDPAITTIDDIRHIRITTQGNSVQLGDIASVYETSKDGQSKSFIATPNHEPQQSVTFNVFKSSSSNIDDTASIVEKKVNEVVAPYGDQFKVTNITNAGSDIKKRYTDLLGDFGSTILLVFINLFLFLGLRQALLASFTIPLTFLSSLIFMNMFGMTINFISLFAFLLALGTSIDDTIVTVSSMTTYYRTNRFTPQETGLLVWRDFIVPIWSTTITTIWAYLPLLLSTGIIGEFIKPIPIVVTATMISSTFFAVTVTLPLLIVILKPAMAPRVRIMLQVISALLIGGVLIAVLPKNIFLPFILVAIGLLIFVYTKVRRALVHSAQKQISALGNVSSRIKPYIVHGIINSEKLGLIYRRVITRVLTSKHGRRNTIIAVIAFALFAYLLLPLGFVKNEFFPKADADIMYMNIELPSGTNNEIVEKEALHIANEVRKIQYVKNVFIDVGRTFNGQGSSAAGGSASIVIELVPKEQRSTSSVDIAQNLRNKYKTYSTSTISVQEESGGPPAGSDIQIKLLGDDLTVLDHYANNIVSYLQKQRGITDVTKSLKPGTSKLVFVPDNDKLSAAGVSVDQVALAMRTYASGFTLDKIKFDNKEKEINMRMDRSSATPEELNALTVSNTTGVTYPISALGTIKLENNPTVITREGGKRTISVSATVQPGFNIAELNKNMEAFADTKLNLPSGYSWQTGGVNEENAKSVASIFQAMGLSFILILITMVVQFGSYRQAAIVLMLIPLAISGVFIVFALSGTPLSFPALIGVLALFGIVVTNAMFIVDKINRNRREGMDLEHAIADAAESRLEPILLTSLTTILGLIPITISDPLWRGLGGAIIAGLTFSGAIMLFFVPVIYYMWFRKDEVKSDNTGN